VVTKAQSAAAGRVKTLIERPQGISPCSKGPRSARERFSRSIAAKAGDQWRDDVQNWQTQLKAGSMTTVTKKQFPVTRLGEA
jgi:hypothetical protein